METEEELIGMSHDDLVKLVIELQDNSLLLGYERERNNRLRKMLESIGIILEVYKNE